MPTRTIRKPAKGQAVGVVKIVPGLASREEQLAAGRALRESTPRERHAIWNPPLKRRDPVDVLQ